MLILSRKSRESVVVGDSNCLESILKVTVLQIIGRKVILGFEGNKDVPVLRWEVWERIRSSAQTEMVG